MGTWAYLKKSSPFYLIFSLIILIQTNNFYFNKNNFIFTQKKKKPQILEILVSYFIYSLHLLIHSLFTLIKEKVFY